MKQAMKNQKNLIPEELTMVLFEQFEVEFKQKSKKKALQYYSTNYER